MLSLIGAFYYLRVVKLMYFDEPQDTSPIVADGSNTRACSRSTAWPCSCSASFRVR